MHRTRTWRIAWRLAVADFKLRNEGSYLGILWYLLNPLLLFFVLFLVFFDRLGSGIEAYPAYLIIGILIFNFFARTTGEATNVILESGFIKSLAFPREALVLAVVLKHLLVHACEAAVFFIVLGTLGVPFVGVLAYAAVLIFVAAFTYGVALFLAALTTRIIDLGNLWQFFIMILWFATPIFYAIEGQERLQALNVLNPLYYFMTAARDLVVYQVMPMPWILAGVAAAPVVALVLGSVTFTRLKGTFSELV